VSGSHTILRLKVDDVVGGVYGDVQIDVEMSQLDRLAEDMAIARQAISVAFETVANFLLERARRVRKIPAYFAIDVAVRYKQAWTNVPNRSALAHAWFTDAFSADVFGTRLLAEEYRSQYENYEGSVD